MLQVIFTKNITVKSEGSPTETDRYSTKSRRRRVEVRFHAFVTSILVGGEIRGSHNGAAEYLRLARNYAMLVTDVSKRR